eukprot:SAG11_NODE_5337_length_1590_cov_1.878605_2_plen_199_part_00
MPPTAKKLHVLYDPYSTAKSEVVYRQNIVQTLPPTHHRKGTDWTRPPLHTLTNSTYGSFSDYSKSWDTRRAALAERAERGAARARPHSVGGARRSSGESRRSSGDSFFERPASAASYTPTDSSICTTDRSVVNAGKEEFCFLDGNVSKPLFPTQRKLQRARKKAMLPHKSFDVDGDGAVSGNDFYLANQFDVDNDGVQ